MPATAFQRICTVPSEVKAVVAPDGSRYVEGVASSATRDRQGEIVNQAALERAFKSAFGRTGKGLPYLRDHWTSSVVGKVVEYELREGSIWTKAKLVPHGLLPAADELVTLLEADIPMSQSIGFNPIPSRKGPWDFSKSGDEDDDGVWHWGGREGDKDFDLLELSAVTMGANPDADLQLGKSLGLDMRRPWVRDFDERIVAGIALKDVEDPEELRFLEDACRSLGSLTGMDNILRHWAKEGRDLSPELFDALLSPMSKLAEVLKAGRVLSDKNREAVAAAVAALQDVLVRDDESRNRGSATEADGESQKYSGFAAAILGYPTQ